jgi:predicted metal-dependent peptidase
MGHLGKDGRLAGPNIDHNKANLAEDCAINQLINMNVPKSAIMPDNLLKDKSVIVKPNMNSEYYYKLLLENEPEQNEPKDSEYSEGQGNSADNIPLDTHSTWEESNGDPDLQKDITSQLLEKAVENTVKDRGTLPHNIEHMMNMFKRKAQIDWKKVLRNIVGQKRVGKRPTIMRRSRRFQNRPDIKGHTKDRMFDLVAFVDISGSMNDSEVLQGLNEISSICKTFNTKLKVIQIDTEVHKIEEFTKNTKLFERKGCGGTIMENGINYLFNTKITYDAIIFISDMFVEDIRDWKKQPKCKVMWLATDNHIPDWNGFGKHKVYPLKIEKDY